MAGQEITYQGKVLSKILRVVGIDLVAAGEIDAEGKMEEGSEKRKVWKQFSQKTEIE
jgi:NAD(P)H-nitrite reductase large subunit